MKIAIGLLLGFLMASDADISIFQCRVLRFLPARSWL